MIQKGRGRSGLTFNMQYRVKLDKFEGPLDLLLFLIRKNEVDIYDIPIAKITRQYLEYIEVLQILDIESASDFILIAALLMRIKAKLLLPKPLEEEEDEIDDPRQELVDRLLEYKKFKESATELAELENKERKFFRRGSFGYDVNGYDDAMIMSSDVSLFDLIAAFKQVLDKASQVPVHRVEEIDVTLEDRIHFLEQFFLRRKKVAFNEIFGQSTDKILLIVTFIAMLELMRRQFLRVSQSSAFSDITLMKA